MSGDARVSIGNALKTINKIDTSLDLSPKLQIA